METMMDKALRARAMTPHEIRQLPEEEQERILSLRSSYGSIVDGVMFPDIANPKEKRPTHSQKLRAYWLKQAEQCMKENLLITARACLTNAGLFERDQESFFEIWNRKVKEGLERMKAVDNAEITTKPGLK